MLAGGKTLAAAKYQAAAFIRHAVGGEKGTAKLAGDQLQCQPGLLIHLPDGGLLHIFSRFHQPGGKFVYISANRVAVLTHQHDPIPQQTIDRHPIGAILMGHGSQCRRVRIPGGHVIGRGAPVPVDGFQLIVA